MKLPTHTVSHPECSNPLTADESLTDVGLAHDTEYGTAIEAQTNQRGPHRQSDNEGHGAVDRV